MSLSPSLRSPALAPPPLSSTTTPRRTSPTRTTTTDSTTIRTARTAISPPPDERQQQQQQQATRQEQRTTRPIRANVLRRMSRLIVDWVESRSAFVSATNIQQSAYPAGFLIWYIAYQLIQRDYPAEDVMRRVLGMLQYGHNSTGWIMQAIMYGLLEQTTFHDVYEQAIRTTTTTTLSLVAAPPPATESPYHEPGDPEAPSSAFFVEFENTARQGVFRWLDQHGAADGSGIASSTEPRTGGIDGPTSTAPIMVRWYEIDPVPYLIEGTIHEEQKQLQRQQQQQQQQRTTVSSALVPVAPPPSSTLSDEEMDARVVQAVRPLQQDAQTLVRESNLTADNLLSYVTWLLLIHPETRVVSPEEFVQLPQQVTADLQSLVAVGPMRPSLGVASAAPSPIPSPRQLPTIVTAVPTPSRQQQAQSLAVIQQRPPPPQFAALERPVDTALVPTVTTTMPTSAIAQVQQQQLRERRVRPREAEQEEALLAMQPPQRRARMIEPAAPTVQPPPLPPPPPPPMPLPQFAPSSTAQLLDVLFRHYITATPPETGMSPFHWFSYGIGPFGILPGSIVRYYDQDIGAQRIGIILEYDVRRVQANMLRAGNVKPAYYALVLDLFQPQLQPSTRGPTTPTTAATGTIQQPHVRSLSVNVILPLIGSWQEQPQEEEIMARWQQYVPGAIPLRRSGALFGSQPMAIPTTIMGVDEQGGIPTLQQRPSLSRRILALERRIGASSVVAPTPQDRILLQQMRQLEQSLLRADPYAIRTALALIQGDLAQGPASTVLTRSPSATEQQQRTLPPWTPMSGSDPAQILTQAIRQIVDPSSLQGIPEVTIATDVINNLYQQNLQDISRSGGGGGGPLDVATILTPNRRQAPALVSIVDQLSIYVHILYYGVQHVRTRQQRRLSAPSVTTPTPPSPAPTDTDYIGTALFFTAVASITSPHQQQIAFALILANILPVLWLQAAAASAGATIQSTFLPITIPSTADPGVQQALRFFFTQTSASQQDAFVRDIHRLSIAILGEQVYVDALTRWRQFSDSSPTGLTDMRDALVRGMASSAIYARESTHFILQRFAQRSVILPSGTMIAAVPAAQGITPSPESLLQQQQPVALFVPPTAIMEPTQAAAMTPTRRSRRASLTRELGAQMATTPVTPTTPPTSFVPTAPTTPIVTTTLPVPSTTTTIVSMAPPPARPPMIPSGLLATPRRVAPPAAITTTAIPPSALTTPPLQPSQQQTTSALLSRALQIPPTGSLQAVSEPSPVPQIQEPPSPPRSVSSLAIQQQPLALAQSPFATTLTTPQSAITGPTTSAQPITTIVPTTTTTLSTPTTIALPQQTLLPPSQALQINIPSSVVTPGIGQRSLLGTTTTVAPIATPALLSPAISQQQQQQQGRAASTLMSIPIAASATPTTIVLNLDEQQLLAFVQSSLLSNEAARIYLVHLYQDYIRDNAGSSLSNLPLDLFIVRLLSEVRRRYYATLSIQEFASFLWNQWLTNQWTSLRRMMEITIRTMI